MFNEVELRGVAEHCFGNERSPLCNHRRASFFCDLGRFVGAVPIRARPLLSRDDIRVDERQMCDRSKHVLIERRLAAAVRPCKEMKNRRVQRLEALRDLFFAPFTATDPSLVSATTSRPWSART